MEPLEDGILVEGNLWSSQIMILMTIAQFTVVTTGQEGYIEELSTCFYLETALKKFSKSVLYET